MAPAAASQSPGTSAASPSAWSWAQRLIRSLRMRDRARVAEGSEAVEAERVEVVAGEQGEVGVVAGEQARLAVVEEVALVDRLDHEGVLAGRRGGAGAGGGERAERRRRRRLDHVRGDRRVLLAQLRGEGAQRVARISPRRPCVPIPT